MTPPGSTSASNARGFASAKSSSAGTLLPRSMCSKNCTSPPPGVSSTVVAPAAFNASHGCSHSTCSVPSVAKNATFAGAFVIVISSSRRRGRREFKLTGAEFPVARWITQRDRPKDAATSASTSRTPHDSHLAATNEPGSITQQGISRGQGHDPGSLRSMSVGVAVRIERVGRPHHSLQGGEPNAKVPRSPPCGSPRCCTHRGW